jgi:hypothetical protein
MSRIRALVALLVVAFALSAAACGDATGLNSRRCDITNSNTCR